MDIKNNWTPSWVGLDFLELRGQGVDLYGETYAKTSGFDFGRSDLLPNAPVDGDLVTNLRTGMSAAEFIDADNGVGDPRLTNVHATGGIQLGSSGIVSLALGNDFDLLTWGATPHGFVSVLFDCSEVLTTGTYGIMGNAALNDNTNMQYAIVCTAGGNFSIRVNSDGGAYGVIAVAQSVGRHLISIFFEKTSEETFNAHVYHNDAKLVVISKSYPMNDPQEANAAVYPKLGQLVGGSGAAPNIIARRALSRQCNPATYGTDEHEAWIAAEMAANFPRWV